MMQNSNSPNETAMVYPKSTYQDVRPYTTKDGSVIRELMHPAVQGNQNMSLAEATIKPGTETLLHSHRRSEEIYFVREGNGIMLLGTQEFPLDAGTAICIPPGTLHKILNSGATDLKILCCCAPAYSHDDTELLDTRSSR